jgi:hypothetical protein
VTRVGFLMRLRDRFGFLRGVAGAVSYAETGPYAGAPRDPNLRVDDEKTYSTVRYTTERVAYTTTYASADACSRCGRTMVESHEIEHVEGAGTRMPIGAVRACRHCDAGSWMFRSRSAR